MQWKLRCAKNLLLKNIATTQINQIRTTTSNTKKNKKKINKPINNLNKIT